MDDYDIIREISHKAMAYDLTQLFSKDKGLDSETVAHIVDVIDEYIRTNFEG